MSLSDSHRSRRPVPPLADSRAARRDVERRFRAASRVKKLRARAISAAIVAGMFSTTALPAFATGPGPETPTTFESARLETQSLTLDGGADLAGADAGGYGATSTEELAAARAAAEAEQAAEAAEAAAQAAAAAAASSSSGSASTGSGSVASGSVPTPSFSLDAVFQAALQYRGTPYVFGGSTPSGFDCSGFVMYVYAKFGISLPHSVSGQAAVGTRIPLSEARPGDLVMMSGHDGFYAGNGMILDAPRPGKVVQMRPIWTSDYSIVRIAG
ncbi:NlpC/P60 family protein [Labedella populi]|uniref:NlpC/P60 family protein n=1 Tax=Labedella populi TaxID=2498850 RepID=A0A444QCV9_9MICO|nr:C40 family peptidase [Labedella populi]RWZ64514.1 NlpC/P60 family protein [Labedella populi]